ncbi:MAG: methyltransferase domain-containing protein, partial [Microcoleus sp. PH2017_03_ELD_O_A]|nr:methyltransferase domain-containing protein [Microcoleus sp. PH2017_03_ELD_O_A]
MNLVNDKDIVKQYFNSTGFDRWQRIYGDGKVRGLSVCDAGCGVGSLSIPLAEAGAIVCASDISEKMVAEAYDRSTAVPGKMYNISFAAQDLEALTGKFHTVICLDVLIHYPQSKAAEM